ncbi:MAG: DMT family transporter [Gammaproteobacteria bacterium]|nr:DMT family transporter [Gammaproteobacteria bacterium]
MEWVIFTCLAAFMQAVRTAAQKHLAVNLSSSAVTAARYIFGLPFIVGYFFLLSAYYEVFSLVPGMVFFAYASIASVAQIIATICLIRLFTLRNFAIGTSYAKTEALQVAILGTLLFSESLSIMGWLSVVIGVAGILIISFSHPVGLPVQGNNKSISIFLGLASGLFFAITSLSLRKASVSLGGAYLYDAAFTLLFMVVLQSGIISAYLVAKQKQELVNLFKSHKASWFIGITSALGSIGWFTAMTLQNAAYVKALGQVEFFFTLVITRHFFKEHMTYKEITGMVMILVSVIVLVMYT